MSLNSVPQVNREAGNISDEGICVDDTASVNVSTTHQNQDKTPSSATS
jgi:hypothetical protein